MAREKNISAQIVMQNFMFEKFIERLSVSDYKSKFILKGGLLIGSTIGLENRANVVFKWRYSIKPNDAIVLKLKNKKQDLQSLLKLIVIVGPVIYCKSC